MRIFTLLIALLATFPVFARSTPMDFRLTAEAEPLATVAGCVNAISGDFFEIETDLMVDPSDDFHFTRCYDSGSLRNTIYGYGFGSQFPLSIANFDYSKKKAVGWLETRETLFLPFEGKRDSDKAFNMKICSDAVKQGITNYSEGGIGAKTNPYSTNIHFMDKHHRWLNVRLGDATLRQYYFRKERQPTDGNITIMYDLKKEHKPNKHALHFSYMPTGLYEDALKEITLFNFKGDKVLGKIDFAYRNDGFTVTGSNGDTVDYTYTDVSLKWYGNKIKVQALQIVNPSTGPWRRYIQCSKSMKEDRLKFSKIEKPDGRFLQIDYEDGKVKTLKAPIGKDNAKATTHTFEYHRKYTVVTDAIDQKKTYHFEKNRLTLIEDFDHQERFFWHDESDKVGWLKAKAYCDTSGQVFSMVRYEYDDAGNVQEEKLYGNIQGNYQNTFAIDDKTDVILAKGNTHCNVTTREYSKEGFNLLFSETNALGDKTIYGYLHDSNLPILKILYDHDKILLRTFYKYDENPLLIAMIEDDGITTDCDNLSGVTERKITQFKRMDDKPVQVECKTESYLNLTTNQPENLRITKYTYNARGDVEKEEILDSHGQHRYTLLTTYDSKARVIEKSDPMGHLVRYGYDENNNKTSEEFVDEGRKVIYNYDHANRLKSKEEHFVDGSPTLITHFAYDLLSRLVDETDPYGHVTHHDYSNYGRTETITLPPVESAPGQNITPITKRFYNFAGQLIKEIDANNNATEYTNNIFGQPTLIKHPDGTIETFRYNLDGSLSEHNNTYGGKICYSYDALGQKTKEEEFDNTGNLYRQTLWEYKGTKLIKHTDPKGNITEYRYDNAGRLIEEIVHTETGPASTTYAYDSLGRREKTCSGEKIAIVVYDNLDRIIEERTEDSDGCVLLKKGYEYNARGQCTATHLYTDEENCNTSTIQYYDNGFVKSETDPLNHTTLHFYTFGSSLIHKVIDPLGITTIEEMNASGDPVHIYRLDPMGQEISESKLYYDAAGNKIRHDEFEFYQGIKKQPYSVTWTYDSRHQVKTITEQNTKITRYDYEKNLLKCCRKSNGIALTYSYDEIGRLRSLHSSDQTISYTFSYDQNDNLTTIEDSILTQTTLREYDSKNRLRYEKFANGLTSSYAYDELDRVKKVILPDNSEITYDHNPLYLVGVSRKGQRHTYQKYDLSGHPLSMQLMHGQKVNLCWDPLGRNSSLQAPNWKQTNDKYDGNGNLLAQTLEDPTGQLKKAYAYDTLNQLIQADGHTYQYDSLGNRRVKNGTAYALNNLNQLL